jgi:hypothetical protein
MISCDGAIRAYLVGTRNHSYEHEYYIRELKIENRDPQRPHDDGGGRSSRFDPDIAEHLSLEYLIPRLSSEIINREVMPYVELHRGQWHHMMWNNQNALANADDLMSGALDTVLSILQNRPYQRGAGSIEEIEENPNQFMNGPGRYYKIPWVLAVAKLMRRVEPLPRGINPTLDIFDDAANLEVMHLALARETGKLREHLREERGYNI